MSKNFFKYKDLLSQLVVRDLKTRYRRSVLGYLWSVLNPLLMMMVLTFVFSTLFKNDIPNFPIYLLSGQLIYNYFSEATNMALHSILSGAALIKKVSIPKYILPFSRTLSAFVNLLFSLVAIIIVMLITRTPLTWNVLLFPFPLFYIFLVSTGIGLVLSAMAVYFRDIIHLYGVFLTILMYMTPIFYPISILPNFVRNIIRINPLFHIVEMFRMVVLYNTVPTVRNHLVCLGFGVITLFIGLCIFRKSQDQFILHI